MILKDILLWLKNMPVSCRWTWHSVYQRDSWHQPVPNHSKLRSCCLSCCRHSVVLQWIASWGEPRGDQSGYHPRAFWELYLSSKKPQIWPATWDHSGDWHDRWVEGRKTLGNSMAKKIEEFLPGDWGWRHIWYYLGVSFSLFRKTKKLKPPLRAL